MKFNILEENNFLIDFLIDFLLQLLFELIRKRLLKGLNINLSLLVLQLYHFSNFIIKFKTKIVLVVYFIQSGYFGLHS